MTRPRFTHLDAASRPQVVAHRGASRAARENTVEAFAKARALRADGVEFDVRRTADSALVVHHDPTLADGSVLVELALAGLRARAPWVPTLDEAVDACQGLWLNVEIKNLPVDPDWDPSESVAEQVVATVTRRSLHDRVIVSSFMPTTLARIREHDPDLATALLTVTATPAVVAIEAAADAGHVAVHPEWRSLNGEDGREALERARERGVAVVPWTVNDPSEIARLARLGVAGVITDEPDRARQAIGNQPTGTTSVNDSGS